MFDDYYWEPVPYKNKLATSSENLIYALKDYVISECNRLMRMKRKGDSDETILAEIKATVDTVIGRMEGMVAMLQTNAQLLTDMTQVQAAAKVPELDRDEKTRNRLIQVAAMAYEFSGYDDLYITHFDGTNYDYDQELSESLDYDIKFLAQNEINFIITHFGLLMENVTGILFANDRLNQKAWNYDPLMTYVKNCRSKIRRALKFFVGIISSDDIQAAAQSKAQDTVSDIQDSTSESITPEQDSSPANTSDKEPVKAESTTAPKESNSRPKQMEIDFQNNATMQNHVLKAEGIGNQHDSWSMKLNVAEFQLQAQTDSDLQQNLQRFQGVLLPVEIASESAPSVGPSSPLYVTKEAALKAAQYINESGGLPLDAAEDLSGHDDEGIVGVMNKAEVVNNKLVVSGNLFPNNKPDLVGKIQAAKDELGMSVNATVQGFAGLLNDAQIFCIDHLSPWGANILKANRATWRTSSVLQASRLPDSPQDAKKEQINNASEDKSGINNAETLLPEETNNGNILELDAIQASKATSNSINNQSSEETSMENQQLAELINGLSKQVTEMNQTQTEKTTSLEQQITQTQQDVNQLIQAQAANISTLTQSVQELMNDKQALQAAANEAKAKQEEETKYQTMVKAVSETVSQNILGVLNPSGQPTRKTTMPLVQASATTPNADTQTTSALNPLQIQLIQAEAKVQTLEQQSITGAERIEALDQVKDLKMQLGMAV